MQVFFKDEVIKQVNVPTINGVFGILPQHVPTLAVLQPGVVSVVVNDSETKNIFGKVIFINLCDRFLILHLLKNIP